VYFWLTSDQPILKAVNRSKTIRSPAHVFVISHREHLAAAIPRITSAPLLHSSVNACARSVDADAQLTYVPTQVSPNSNRQKNPAQEMVREESDWVSGISVTGSTQRRRQHHDRFFQHTPLSRHSTRTSRSGRAAHAINRTIKWWFRVQIAGGFGMLTVVDTRC